MVSAYTSARIRDRCFFAQNQTAKHLEVGVGSTICLLNAGVSRFRIPIPNFAGCQAIAMKQSEQKNRRLLTGLARGPRLAIPERGQGRFANERETSSGFACNELRIHSRIVYVSLLLRRKAGVFHGIVSEATSGSRQPTRHEARWVFAFWGDAVIAGQLMQSAMAA